MGNLLHLLNSQNNDVADVLESYAIAASGRNDFNILKEWVERYPQFAEELIEFAAECTIDDRTPDQPVSAELERIDRDAARARLSVALHNRRDVQPITSLIGLAKKERRSMQSFAAAAGLSVSLLMHLERRRVEFASIPGQLVRRLAELLSVGDEAVAEFLRLGPDRAPEMSYKADLMPLPVVQKSFADVVREDQMLSREQKLELLNLADE